ncbi:MAG: YhjD/YihY/BrkB family envelope integrity protein [Pseudomonadota bacterium]
MFEGIIESKTGFAAAISAMVGLWAGSNAFEAARIGFNKAYDVKEDRPFMKRRLQSLTLAAAAASVFVLQAFLIVLWPLISNLLEGDPLRNMDFESFDLLRYVVGMPLFMVLLSILHSRRPRGRRRGFMLHVRTEHGEDWAISIVPGVIASTLLWFLGATAFSLYLRFAP